MPKSITQMTFECAGFGQSQISVAKSPSTLSGSRSLSCSLALCDCDNILCKSLPNSAETAITMTHLTTANNLFTLHYATSKGREMVEGEGKMAGPIENMPNVIRM